MWASIKKREDLCRLWDAAHELISPKPFGKNQIGFEKYILALVRAEVITPEEVQLLMDGFKSNVIKWSPG